MSTRGAIGFRLNGKDYIAYNHSDSYPDGLGADFVKQVTELLNKMGSPDTLRAQFAAVRLVDENTPPTDEDITRFSAHANTSVGNQTKTDWYCLLRELQGNLSGYLEAGVMIDGASFLLDSLFCEYAYILNLDTMECEFYQGFNEKKGKKKDGRYAALHEPLEAGETKPKYYGVRLVGTCPANAIPADWQEQFYPSKD